MSQDINHRASIDFSEDWSDRGGQTRDLWNGTHSTAVSSDTSAQAVAGHNVPISLGTETHPLATEASSVANPESASPAVSAWSMADEGSELKYKKLTEKTPHPTP
ncbi:hypothetical protein MBLNU230_g0581t1 [Neophaeotheca triangularis]